MFETRKPTPQIIVVDDFYQDPIAVREFALAQEFKHNEAYHKGRRTETRFAPLNLKEAFESYLGRKVTNWDYYIHNGVFQICVSGETLVYHSDVQTYAATIYLTPDAPPSSGLRTVQSKETRLRRAPTAEAAAKAGVPIETMVSRTYENKLLDYSAWETVDQTGSVFNRLVIFDAKLLHAAGGYFGHDLHTGRLFQMFFFDVE